MIIQPFLGKLFRIFIKKLIAPTLLLLVISCVGKDSTKVVNTIRIADGIFIYKYDNSFNGYSLFNIPDSLMVNVLKEKLVFDGKFNAKIKEMSSNFRLDLYLQDSLIGRIYINNTSLQYLNFEYDNGAVASRKLDYQFGMYLGELANNLDVTLSEKLYSFRFTEILGNKVFGFSKHPDASEYTNLFIRTYYDGSSNKSNDLESVTGLIDKCWKIVQNENVIALENASVGYPLEYDDVLINQISAFKNSAEWSEHIKKNGKKPNHELTIRIMLENDVYGPLNQFLKTKGFKIEDLSLEKLGFLEANRLENLGFDKHLIIPIPFMVWIKIGLV